MFLIAGKELGWETGNANGVMRSSWKTHSSIVSKEFPSTDGVLDGQRIPANDHGNKKGIHIGTGADSSFGIIGEERSAASAFSSADSNVPKIPSLLLPVSASH